MPALLFCLIVGFLKITWRDLSLGMICGVQVRLVKEVVLTLRSNAIGPTSKGAKLTSYLSKTTIYPKTNDFWNNPLYTLAIKRGRAYEN